MINFRTIGQLDRTIAANVPKLRAIGADAVCGIPRSGSLVASMVALRLQLPMVDLESGHAYGRSGKPGERPKRVMLVDDSLNSGRAMSRAMSTLVSRSPGIDVRKVVVYGPYKPLDPPRVFPDLALEECHGPRVFEWNWTKHIRLPRWAVDMDGVLCRDPVKGENDDGPRYLQFIREAEPMYLPQRRVHAIVTARLDRYREETAKWLERHGVEYGALIMMEHATKAERMAAGGRGAWKAEQAKALGVEMFVESNVGQARTIAANARIAVYCPTTGEVF